jgi:triosephosphate isomerase
MKLIVGNWKMTIGTRESIALARAVLLSTRGKRIVPDVVLCPSFVALGEVRKVLAKSRVTMGAQDVFWEDTGAFTGEVSPRMLLEFGVTHVIVGHSERREHLRETDDMVHAKVLACLRQNLVPILCVGETREQRQRGEAEAVVSEQVRAAVRHARVGREGLVVAYEPVWAIGAADAATPADAVMMHEMIRRILREELPAHTVNVPVLYGGSVDGSHAYAFLREPAVDGVLVGGASVKISQWNEILKAASDVLEAQGEK